MIDERLQPSYKTISSFRKDNVTALKTANRNFVMLCKLLELFGGELAAIDGSFFRGNVAKESIFTQARLKKHLKRIDAHIQAYCRNWRRPMPQGASLRRRRHH